ncbi:MFS transporter [Sphingomonas sp. ERG5]|uniref:MFS transporter n=1 Tax=Sphingomonas sp. ERG5 TaxID=1381597 RepID=UPI00068F66E0|nr:MFS transporter [Sphingomonas sp. ERG5]
MEAEPMADRIDHAGAQRLLRLPLGIKLGYAAGQLLEGVIVNATNIFLLFYVTAVCGLSGWLAGIALAAGLIVDAVMDPIIGSMSDGWRSHYGRRLPFMVAGLIPVILCFVGIFSLPVGLDQALLFAIVTALSILLRVSLSLFILPYQAIGAELSDNYNERSGIMAWRWGVGYVGALIAVLLGFGVFFRGKTGLSRHGAYTPFALSLSIVVIVGALLAMRAVWATRDRHHPPVSVEGNFLLRVFGELVEVFRNRSFRILFIGALLFFLALSVHTALGLHANTFFWHFTSGQTQMVTLAIFSGLLFGAPLAGPFLARMEKRTVLVIGMTGLTVAQAGPTLLRLLGLFPWEGDMLALILSVIMLIGGALMAAAGIAFASMMADAADEHEHLFGARREGLYYAGWAFAVKASAGLGALVAGAVLSMIDFPTDLAAHGGTAAVLPERMVDMLGLFYGPGAAVLSLAAVLSNLWYRLDSKAHAAIMTDLTERRRATANAASMVGQMV